MEKIDNQSNDLRQLMYSKYLCVSAIQFNQTFVSSLIGMFLLDAKERVFIMYLAEVLKKRKPGM